MDEYERAYGPDHAAVYRGRDALCKKVKELEKDNADLRARVKELERDQEAVQRRAYKAGFDFSLQSASPRQVTREQINSALALTRDQSTMHNGREPKAEKWLDDFFRTLGLEIVEDAPEGRECDCPKVQADRKGGVWWFACEQADRTLVATRCTITEGEHDETR